MDESIKNSFNEVWDCSNFLDKYLTSEPFIPMSINDIPRHIDYVVAHYLVEKGYTEWLIKNGEAYQIGGISESALSGFASEEKIFNGRSGEFRIYEHEVNGTKYFFAKPIEKHRA